MVNRTHLDNEFLSSHAGNGDTALHNRGDDLHNGLVHRHGHQALQLQPLCYGSQGRVDLHIGMQICEQTLVYSTWGSCRQKRTYTWLIISSHQMSSTQSVQEGCEELNIRQDPARWQCQGTR